MQFGSHIYGTNLPTSDQDFKSVFLPDAKSLILQRAPLHLERNTKLNERDKNTPDDIDDESFSIQHFLKLLCQGQTVALDMLFTPRRHWTGMTGESHHWDLILENKNRFLHKGTSAFVGYTKAQAAKYGVKGFRVAALKQTLEFLGSIPGDKRLGDIANELIGFALGKEYINIIMIEGSNHQLEPALEVCNRKLPFHAKVDYAVQVLTQIFNNYGHRALLAERNEGVDWKALMHAVRVAHEAQELLTTGQIVFPRPEKELLLKIRKAELAYKEVAEIIEEGLVKVSEAQEKSLLPEKPDFKFADDLIYFFHKEEIAEHIGTTL